MEKTRALRKEKVLADFENLSGRYKKEAADFIAYLKIKEELKATKEILNDNDLVKSIMKGDRDFKQGRFKKWADVKKNV